MPQRANSNIKSEAFRSDVSKPHSRLSKLAIIHNTGVTEDGTRDRRKLSGMTRCGDSKQEKLKVHGEKEDIAC